MYFLNLIYLQLVCGSPIYICTLWGDTKLIILYYYKTLGPYFKETPVEKYINFDITLKTKWIFNTKYVGDCFGFLKIIPLLNCWFALAVTCKTISIACWNLVLLNNVFYLFCVETQRKFLNLLNKKTLKHQTFWEFHFWEQLATC